MEEESSSSSYEMSSGSNGSNKLNNNKEKNKESENERNSFENSNISNKINIINRNSSDNNIKKSDYKKFIETKNYFKVYEEFKFQLGNYAKRSQVSIFIIIEFLRNLKVHSFHITEIVNDFTDYLKLKNKWKKFNDNEITYFF